MGISVCFIYESSQACRAHSRCSITAVNKSKSRENLHIFYKSNYKSLNWDTEKKKRFILKESFQEVKPEKLSKPHKSRSLDYYFLTQRSSYYNNILLPVKVQHMNKIHKMKNFMMLIQKTYVN